MSEVSKAAERLSKNGYSSTIELDAAGPTGFVIVNGGTWDALNITLKEPAEL